MDFAVGLSVSKGYDSIMSFVRDIPTNTREAAAEVTQIFFDAVICHDGLPRVIVSIIDPRLTT